MLKEYIGDKPFYKRLLALMVPIMIQTGITNFVSMLDNIMIGSLGAEAMTGVAVVNQLIFVFNLCIFGAVSGAGLFGAQYFGKGDMDGVRHTFRFKMISSAVITIAFAAVFCFAGERLIGLYLKGEGSAESIAAAMLFGKKYMAVMLVGLLPYAFSQCYSGTLRENNQAIIPMQAGIVAVIVNLCLNYVLIYGAFGIPALGVVGAAIATVIARVTEFAVVAIWTGRNTDKNEFILGAFKSLYIPRKLVSGIMIKGMPLVANETLWAIGVAIIGQSYSMHGIDVVAANNINQTFCNVFSIIFGSTGGAIGILLGQKLGNGDLEGARGESKKLLAFSVCTSVVICALYIVSAKFVPHIYNVDNHVKELATRLMQISGLTMPLISFSNACYFTLRSGGKMAITFMFDNLSMWGIKLPVAYLLTKYTDMNILFVYALTESTIIAKCLFGGWFVKKGVWIKNMVGTTEQDVLC